VPRFVEIGAQVIGACCGSSPAHIAAMASRLADALPAWPATRSKG
jgi:S-methylmethionine-dependent homocysteine/selenocysteine methylase